MKLPTCKPRQVIRALGKAGFYVHHQTGSHVAMRHVTDKTKRVTVPRHGKDLKKGTLASILDQAGLAVEEFSKTALILEAGPAAASSM